MNKKTKTNMEKEGNGQYVIKGKECCVGDGLWRISIISVTGPCLFGGQGPPYNNFVLHEGVECAHSC